MMFVLIAQLLLLQVFSLPSAAPQSLCNQVTVKNGDTLSGIATEFNSTIAAIQAANPSITDPSLIQVGQVIDIPCARDQSASPAPAPGAAACGSVIVKAGDSLYSIGAANGASIGQLLAANPSIQQPNLIQVGDTIALPCIGSQDVTITADQFNRSLTVNGFAPRNDTIRQDMLSSISTFGNNTVIASATELAMFLSQAIFETGGLATLKEVGGENRSYAPYYGRGYLQLTGQSNYQAASLAIFANASILLKNPDMILTNDTLAWGVSTWFWKTNVHSREGISSGEFGISTRALNSIECTPGNVTAQNRCNIYGKVLPILVSDTTANCSGCTT